MPDIDQSYLSRLNQPIPTDTASEGWLPDEDFLSDMEDFGMAKDKPKKCHLARSNTEID